MKIWRERLSRNALSAGYECLRGVSEWSFALANNLILVTHNTREFERVDELRVEDWEIGG